MALMNGKPESSGRPTQLPVDISASIFNRYYMIFPLCSAPLLGESAFSQVLLKQFMAHSCIVKTTLLTPMGTNAHTLSQRLGSKVRCVGGE